MLRRMMIAGGGGTVDDQWLDGLAVRPLAVSSLKKLVSTATAAIRVRRSSDNAEMDIGFSGRELDNEALLAFAVGSSAYVVSWYDQTGNGYHRVQPDASKQPRIVNSGVYDAAVIFDGVNDSLVASSVALSQPAAALFFDGVLPEFADVRVFMEAGANWNSAPYSFIVHSSSNEWNIGMNSIPPDQIGQKVLRFPGLDMGARKVLSVLFDRSKTGSLEILAWSGGFARVSGGIAGYEAEQTGSFATHDHYMGGRGASSLYAAMKAVSCAVYDGDTSSIRPSIEAILSA